MDALTHALIHVVPEGSPRSAERYLVIPESDLSPWHLDFLRAHRWSACSATDFIGGFAAPSPRVFVGTPLLERGEAFGAFHRLIVAADPRKPRPNGRDSPVTKADTRARKASPAGRKSRR